MTGKLCGISHRLEPDVGSTLIQRIRRREPDALAELYDDYAGLAYAVAFRVIGQRATAEDILQESFLRAWDSASKLRDEYPSPGPWFLTIVRNCALNYLKSAEVRMLAGTVCDTIEVASDWPAHDNGTSLDHAEVIAHAMAELSENQRHALELAYYEGLSQVAIAERLHQPLGTVKSWIRQGLLKLRNAIDRTKIEF
jgi:RNA polymerase sigma-70 factor (ECF subfamily)